MKSFMLSIIFISLLLCSCWEDMDNDDHVYGFDSKEFDAQQAKWQEANIKNYQFTQQLWYTYPICDPVKITVKNSIETSEENLNNNILGSTIDAIYNRIKRDIEDDKKPLYNKEISQLYITIEYDETWHYPKKITHNHRNEPDGVAAHGQPLSYNLYITDFKELPD